MHYICNFGLLADHFHWMTSFFVCRCKQVLFDSQSARRETVDFRKNCEHVFKQITTFKLRIITSKCWSSLSSTNVRCFAVDTALYYYIMLTWLNGRYFFADHVYRRLQIMQRRGRWKRGTGKCRTGKLGTKSHGWKSQDWKTEDQFCRGGKRGTGKHGNIICMDSQT